MEDIASAGGAGSGKIVVPHSIANKYQVSYLSYHHSEIRDH